MLDGDGDIQRMKAILKDDICRSIVKYAGHAVWMYAECLQRALRVVHSQLAHAEDEYIRR